MPREAVQSPNAADAFSTDAVVLGRRAKSDQLRVMLRLFVKNEMGKAVARWLQLVICISAVASVAACATGYRPLGTGGGYEATTLGPDTYLVRFQGNGNTREQQVSDFAMLRAAELALQNGCCCFAVIDVTNSSAAFHYLDYARADAGLTPDVTSVSAQPFLPVTTPHVFYQPGTVLTIKCFQARPEVPFTYEAAPLRSSLRQKYGLKS